MDLWLIAQVLRKRRTLRGHERWSRRELEHHQATALGALRDHAITRSRFYQRFHRGLEGKPLGELPVLTKAELMASFDELVVDPDVRRADVERHLAALRGNEHDRPVPAGTPGAKLLVTVLFSRTQPLIRYEMSDRLILATDACECGLPFGVVAAIEGRAEDMLSLPGVRGGTISIHPNLFHRVLEVLPTREWQVIQDEWGLRILLGRAGPVATAQIADDVARELRGAGAIAPPIRIEIVDAVPRTALGKAPLVVARRGGPAEAPSG